MLANVAQLLLYITLPVALVLLMDVYYFVRFYFETQLRAAASKDLKKRSMDPQQVPSSPFAAPSPPFPEIPLYKYFSLIIFQGVVKIFISSGSVGGCFQASTAPCAQSSSFLFEFIAAPSSSGRSPSSTPCSS